MTINTLGIAKGGTGQTTKAPAFNALSPITSVGDLILGNGVDSAIRLPIGTVGQLLTSNGTTASWAAPATNGTVTSVGLSSSDGFISVAGTPVTASGTLATKGGTGLTSWGGGGSILVAVTASSATTLSIGSSNQVLKVVSSTPAWATPYISTGVANINVGTAVTTVTTSTTGYVAIMLTKMDTGTQGATNRALVESVENITPTSFDIRLNGSAAGTPLPVAWMIW
jgi:hypothetical protein